MAVRLLTVGFILTFMFSPGVCAQVDHTYGLWQLTFSLQKAATLSTAATAEYTTKPIGVDDQLGPVTSMMGVKVDLGFLGETDQHGKKYQMGLFLIDNQFGVQHPIPIDCKDRKAAGVLVRIDQENARTFSDVTCIADGYPFYSFTVTWDLIDRLRNGNELRIYVDLKEGPGMIARFKLSSFRDAYSAFVDGKPSAFTDAKLRRWETDDIVLNEEQYLKDAASQRKTRQ